MGKKLKLNKIRNYMTVCINRNQKITLRKIKNKIKKKIPC